MTIQKLQKKKNKKNILHGLVHVHAGLSNTIITLTDFFGNTLCWSSAGNVGFKGSRKKTPFAAQLAAKNLIAKASDLGIQKIDIILKGHGKGRDSLIRIFKNQNLQILSITDNTPIAHNGCRPPKKRRL